MPRDKDVKRVVRKRMAETGERYTEARDAIRPAGYKRRSTKRCARGDGGRLVAVDIPVHGGVRMQLATGQHFVVMKEREGARSLPIWIGMPEANAIAVTLTQWKVERPLTADLLTSTITALGGEVERVVITRCENGCFFAEVHVRRDGTALAPMDARPSDALGIAVRVQAPIFVAATVMDAFGSELEDHPDTVAVGSARVQSASAAATPSPAYTPVIAPTHMLVDVANNRVITLIGFPPGVARQPEAGTLMTLGTPQNSRQYRVVSVEPDAEGITPLRVEVVAEPIAPGSRIVTVEPPREG